MARTAGFAGVLTGCLGAAYLLRVGWSSPSSMADDAPLIALYGALSLSVFLLSAWFLASSNRKGVLCCGAGLAIFTVLGIMSVGAFLLPGAFLLLVPSAIRVLEGRVGQTR